MTFREIQPEDMEAIFEVRVRTWHNSNGAQEMASLGITHESVLDKMRHAHRGWLAEHDHQVVGFTIGDRETGEMWVIAVLKEFENQGIGRALMQLVEDWLISEGCQELWLTTDVDESLRAVGFYRALGWKYWKIEHGDRFMKKEAVRWDWPNVDCSAYD